MARPLLQLLPPPGGTACDSDATYPNLTNRVQSFEVDSPALARPVPSVPRARTALDQRIEASVHNHLALVWRVLRRSGLSAADADDAAQDVFWVLTQRASQVPLRAERSFLLSTALHIASDRRRSSWSRRVTEPLAPELSDPLAASPEQALEQQQRRELLDTALGMLESDERAVFILTELEELSREDTASILGIAAGTVASRLRRARDDFSAAVQRLQRLRRRLS